MSDVRVSGPELAITQTSWLATMMGDPISCPNSLISACTVMWARPPTRAAFYSFIQQSAYPNTHFWMTEFSVWCQSCLNGTGGNGSWANAQGIASALVNHLANGASAGLVFDAYDSVYNGYNPTTGQDVPGPWGFWGLFAVDDVNAVNRTYTPRKQFYTLSQITKYIRPGAIRIDVSGSVSPLTVLAFYNTNNGQFTLTGVNTSSSATTLSCALTSLPAVPSLDFYYTSSTTNLCYGGSVAVNNNAFAVLIPADCVFTLTYTNPVTMSAESGSSGTAGLPTLTYGAAPNGEFQLAVAGQAGQRYTIEVSGDLMNWSELTTVTNQDGIIQISAPMSATRMFYRARLLP